MQAKPSTYHHVGITDGFDFINIVTFDDSIESCVEIIQKVHYLQENKIMTELNLCALKISLKLYKFSSYLSLPPMVCSKRRVR